jgi:hypothetical protein
MAIDVSRHRIVLAVCAGCSVSTIAAAQSAIAEAPSAGIQPEAGKMRLGEPNGPSAADSHAKASQAPASAAPYANGILLGGSIGGGRLQDEVTGVGGVSLELQLGYFPVNWLGVMVSGSGFNHQISDERNLGFYGGSLLAEVHPLPRLWLAVGPGYYALESTTQTAADAEPQAESSSKGFGAELDVGFDIYRAKAPSGLSAGLVFRSQVVPLDGQVVSTTMGLLGVRWYGGGGSSGPRPVESASSTPEEATGLEVASSCGDPLATVLSVLQLGGKPCAYRVGPPGLLSQVTSFATRLLQGSSYGVWLGRLTGVGNAVRGISVRYDQAQSAVQLLRHDGDRVTPSGLVRVASSATQHWRVARTSGRSLIWLNEQLVATEAIPAESLEMGLLTDGARVELSSAERQPLSPEQAQRYDALAPIVWPGLPSVEAETPTPEPVAPEPEPTPEPEIAPELSVLLDYYRALNNGGFDASRYFAPRVARYIGMRNTTPSAIDSYIHNVFPRQFHNVAFNIEESSLRPDGPGAYAYFERASYYNVSLGKNERVVSVVRVRFDEQGKLTHLWQDKVLERSVATPSP